jgi:hypothetical protein
MTNQSETARVLFYVKYPPVFPNKVTLALVELGEIQNNRERFNFSVPCSESAHRAYYNVSGRGIETMKYIYIANMAPFYSAATHVCPVDKEYESDRLD